MPTISTISITLFLQLLLCHTTTAQECDARTGACDTHERCPVWAEEGECVASASYMKEYCPGSCSSSAVIAQHRRRQLQSSDEAGGEEEINDDEEQPNCEDLLERCSVWAELGECDANPDDMYEYCPYSCGVCEGIGEEEYDTSCADQHDKCPAWAELGECDKNPKYMHEHCAYSCDTCPRNEVAPPISKTTKSANNQDVDLMKATRAFGDMQKAEGAEKDSTLGRIQSTLTYMKSEEVQRLPDHVKTACLNRQELCTFWAVSCVCMCMVVCCVVKEKKAMGKH